MSEKFDKNLLLSHAKKKILKLVTGKEGQKDRKRGATLELRSLSPVPSAANGAEMRGGGTIKEAPEAPNPPSAPDVADAVGNRVRGNDSLG
jgi:hypothetical protein